MKRIWLISSLFSGLCFSATLFAESRTQIIILIGMSITLGLTAIGSVILHVSRRLLEWLKDRDEFNFDLLEQHIDATHEQRDALRELTAILLDPDDSRKAMSPSKVPKFNDPPDRTNMRLVP